MPKDCVTKPRGQTPSIQDGPLGVGRSGGHQTARLRSTPLAARTARCLNTNTRRAGFSVGELTSLSQATRRRIHEMTLDEIGAKYGTDKDSRHHDFLRFYERRLKGYREQPFTLVEVGVYRGGSVRMWAEYFPKAQIVGLDVNPDCKALSGGNIHIGIGDASRIDFIFEIINEFGRPLIVIDDGSHRWDHQITTLQLLFPLLVPGGAYVVEDLDTSFDGQLKQAPYEGLSPISAFEYVTKLSRAVTADAAIGDERHFDLFIADNYRWVSTVEFGRRTAVIGKKFSPGGGSD